MNRRSVNRKWLAIGATAVLVLAGCGGDDGGGESNGGTSGADFCDLIRDAKDAEEDFTGLLNSGEVPDSDDLKRTLEKFLAEVKRIEPEAPSELRSAVSGAIDGLEKIKDFFEDRDYDIERIAEDGDQFDQLANDLGEDGEKLDQYVEDECGITDSDDNSDDDSGDGSSTTAPSMPDFSDLSDFNSAADVFAAIYPGLSRDEAECLGDYVESQGADASDANVFFDALEECNLTFQDLAS